MSEEESLSEKDVERLNSIMSEDTGVWKAGGYEDGIFVEDAETLPLNYSDRAEKNKVKTQKAVELQTELELSKQEKALKIAIEEYDVGVLREAKEIKSRYDALVESSNVLKKECEELKPEVEALRKKRSYLKSEKKKLEALVVDLELQVDSYEKPEDTESKTSIGDIEL